MWMILARIASNIKFFVLTITVGTTKISRLTQERMQQKNRQIVFVLSSFFSGSSGF